MWLIYWLRNTSMAGLSQKVLVILWHFFHASINACLLQATQSVWLFFKYVFKCTALVSHTLVYLTFGTERSVERVHLLVSKRVALLSTNLCLFVNLCELGSSVKLHIKMYYDFNFFQNCFYSIIWYDF